MARNIGIFAHVDAGKTTLTERILSVSGAIRKAGRVDEGTAHTDTMDLEKARGISIRAACAGFVWKGQEIYLVDAPGHADFSGEIERALWAVDICVLVISGADGIQPQTEVLMDAFQARKLPVVIFINKLDRDTADYEKVSRAVSSRWPGAFRADSEEARVLLAGETDPELLDAYLAGEAAAERADKLLRESVARGEAYPVFGGSALKGTGTEAFLDGLIEWTREPAPNTDGEASGIVFAVSPDPSMGRAAWVRLFSGSLRTREALKLNRETENAYGRGEALCERKITCIRRVGIGGPGGDTPCLSAGEIGVIYGLGDVRAGQVIGPAEGLKARIGGSLRPALYFARIECSDARALKAALDELSAEDPLLGVSMEEDGINIRLMGAIQLEVLAGELKSRFGLTVSFGPHKVVCRETISRPAEGFVAYTMPKPCWAILRFLLEPGPRGSGVVYESRVSPRDIKPRYQHQVLQALPTALSQGMLGWQVDDIRITLIGGGDHEIHTHPLDFIVATPMGIMDGLSRAGSVLLEPLMEGEFLLPAECLGKLITELNSRGGHILSTEDLPSAAAETPRCRVKAEYPARGSDDLPVSFARLTSGRGLMNSRLSRYEEAPLSPDKLRPRRGVNPLDTAKYILAARDALDGDIFG